MRLLLAVVFAFSVVIPAACTRIPKGIEKTVVFIYSESDGAPQHADGTGFLLGVPVPDHPERSWTYLVTAQHVLHVNGQDLNSPFREVVYVRFNQMKGIAALAELDLRESGANQNVFLDSDRSVDVAVVPIYIPIPGGVQVDGLLLSDDMLVTAEDFKKYNIGVGTDMFFTGMFAPYQGLMRNSPIVRFGKLAMIPDEKINFGGRYEDAYLVETFSFGGNSGSPVFFYPGQDNTPGALLIGTTVLKVAGVMQGFFGDIEPIQLARPTNEQGPSVPVSQSNSGIAVVIPAQHIRNILDSPVLKALRDASLMQSQGQVPK